MSLPHWLVALVAVQRLLEIVYSRRNYRQLLAQGGVEVGAGHYPLLIVLHVAWLASLWVLVPPDAPVAWPWLALYVLLLAGRIWVMASLGRYWTTRIVHLPGVPLIRAGPYRSIRHPNYVVVAGEVAVVPLALDAWRIALVFSVLNAAVLVWRIRVENRSLAARPSPEPDEDSSEPH
jgi:methyltransferase